MTITILHNPRCTKSRATLNMLRDKGIEPTIIEYLENPPTTSEFKEILAKLGLGPRDVIRKGEKIYKQLELADAALSDTALITAMVGNPILIERPIVINGEKAVLGRPPEKVMEIL
jgi:arsenate reductase